jgi:hypothetical protein
LISSEFGTMKIKDLGRLKVDYELELGWLLDRKDADLSLPRFRKAHAFQYRDYQRAAA